MFCAFFYKSVATVFRIQLVLRKNIQSLVSYAEKRSLFFIVWSPVRNLAMVIQYLRCPGLTGPLGPFGLLQHKVKPRPFQPQWGWYHRPGSLVCLINYSLILMEYCVETIFSRVFNTFALTRFNCEALEIRTCRCWIICFMFLLEKQEFSRSSRVFDVGFFPIICMNPLNTLNVQQLFSRSLLTGVP